MWGVVAVQKIFTGAIITSVVTGLFLSLLTSGLLASYQPIPSEGIVADRSSAQVALFRPFPLNYMEASTNYTSGMNTSAYGRQWNFAGWTVNQLNMTVQFSGLVGYTRPVGTMRVYVSIDNGTTYPYSFDLTIPAYTITTNDLKWGLMRGVRFTFDITEYANLFGPQTKIKWTVFGYGSNEFTVSIAYWDLTQTPVPPYDYKTTNYDQYYTMFTVNYTESAINYVPSDKEINSSSDKYNLDLLAQSIENHMQYSGALINTNVSAAAANTWGTGGLIYPSIADRTIRSLIKLAQYDPVNRNHYLVMSLRYINWSFSILTTQPGVPGEGKAYELQRGGSYATSPQMIDSGSATPMELVALYYNATNDMSLVDATWADLQQCYIFLKSLNVSVGPAAGLPVNGWYPRGSYYYPSNGTADFERSYLIYLQDSCEVYWGLKAFAYLAGLKGDTTLQTEANTWANSMEIKLNNFFWDEAAGKYLDAYWINSNNFETALSYGMLALGFYRISNNESRLYSTVKLYTSWGGIGGMYYNYTNPAKYEMNTRVHSTMISMLQVILATLKVDNNDSTLYPEYANYTQFLYDNPVYGGSLLNNAGYLGWVDVVHGTYSPEYDRTLAGVAWGIEGILAYHVH